MGLDRKILYMQKIYNVYNCGEDFLKRYYVEEQIKELFNVDIDTFLKNVNDMWKLAEKDFYLEKEYEYEIESEEE